MKFKRKEDRIIRGGYGVRRDVLNGREWALTKGFEILPVTGIRTGRPMQ